MAASITHAVVKWISKSQIQVNYVKISDIDNKGLDLVEKKIYSVTWLDNKKYKAELLSLGKIYWFKKII